MVSSVTDVTHRDLCSSNLLPGQCRDSGAIKRLLIAEAISFHFSHGAWEIFKMFHVCKVMWNRHSATVMHSESGTSNLHMILCQLCQDISNDCSEKSESEVST